MPFPSWLSPELRRTLYDDGDRPPVVPAGDRPAPGRVDTETTEWSPVIVGHVTKWLQSGLRRDVCIVLAGEGELHGQQLKARIADHYDERIDPSSFYGALDSLVDTGHLAVHEAGLHDAYALTDAGRAMVEEQFEWMREHVEE